MLIGACALGAGSIVTMAGPASAVDVETYKNQATQQCLDDSGKGFRTIGCNGKVTQKWNASGWGDRTVRLQSRGTKQCIDDSAKGLRTFKCHKGVNNPNRKFQSWKVIPLGGGGIQFQNKATKRCIDDSAKGLRSFKCQKPGNNLNFQRWR